MDITIVALTTLVLGVLAGAAVALALSRSRLHELRARLQSTDEELAAARAEFSTTVAELAVAEAHAVALREQLEDLRADREHLTSQFKAVSGDVLKETSKELARQAAADRTAAEAQVKSELEQRSLTFAGLVKPLAENLAKFDAKVDLIEGARREQAGALETQLKALGSGVGELGKNADSLVTALRRPNVRGAWGELQLVTAFEHAGLVEGVNFTLQQTVNGDDGGRLRPDAVVTLPGGKSVVVDAKVPFAAYQEACEAQDAGEVAALMVRHAGARARACEGAREQGVPVGAAHGRPCDAGLRRHVHPV